MTPVGYQIRNITSSRGLPLKELARAIGLDPSHLSSMLHGRRKLSSPTLQKIAATLNLPPDKTQTLELYRQLSNTTLKLKTDDPDLILLCNLLTHPETFLSMTHLKTFLSILLSSPNPFHTLSENPLHSFLPDAPLKQNPPQNPPLSPPLPPENPQLSTHQQQWSENPPLEEPHYEADDFSQSESEQEFLKYSK